MPVVREHYVAYSADFVALFNGLGIQVPETHTFGNATGWYESEFETAYNEAWDAFQTYTGEFEDEYNDMFANGFEVLIYSYESLIG